MNVDRRPRRLVPLLAAVLAIALLSGQSMGNAAEPPSSIAATPAPSRPAATAGPVAVALPSLVPAGPVPAPSESPGLATPPPPTRRPGPAPAPVVHIPRGGVPIVYYHRVESIPADFRSWGRHRKRTFLAYDSLPDAFDAQLDWLKAHGYTTILPRDLAAHWDPGHATAATSGDPGV